MTITPNMTDAEKIAALQKYILDGTEMRALQKIADLSSGNPCEPLYSIHGIAISTLGKVTANAEITAR